MPDLRPNPALPPTGTVRSGLFTIPTPTHREGPRTGLDSLLAVLAGVIGVDPRHTNADERLLAKNGADVSLLGSAALVAGGQIPSLMREAPVLTDALATLVEQRLPVGRARYAYPDGGTSLPPRVDTVNALVQGGHNEPYAILSAANPPGHTMPPEMNALRNTEMAAAIRKMGLNPVPTHGVFGGTPEPSMFVKGMTRDEAARVANRVYGGVEAPQHSVLTNEGITRIADRAVFPKNGPTQVGVDLGDFYTEYTHPGTATRSAEMTRFSQSFPDAAFESAVGVPKTGENLRRLLNALGLNRR